MDIPEGGFVRCAYCVRGCKCGRKCFDEGTCIYCGHGIPTKGVEFAYKRRTDAPSDNKPVDISNIVVPLPYVRAIQSVPKAA